jgi:hypothetical protein
VATVLGPAACHTRPAETAVRLRPGGSAQRGKRLARPVATHACNGTVARSATARRRQGLVGDLEWATGEVPGKEERVGAHRNGVPTVRRCKRHRVAVFNDGGVAPVVINEDGWVLQLEGEPGVRRRWSIEERSSSEGRSPKGGSDDGDARTESGTEEGLRWRKTSEVDPWAMGDECAVLGHG